MLFVLVVLLPSFLLAVDCGVVVVCVVVVRVSVDISDIDDVVIVCICDVVIVCSGAVVITVDVVVNT